MIESVRLAGGEEPVDFSEDCCQNCGFDLSDYRGEGAHRWKTGPRACDECPNCRAYPRWTSGSIRSEARKEILVCGICGEDFVRRVTVTIDAQHCGDRLREVVRRCCGASRCDACGELLAAARHEKAAVLARGRAAKRRLQQRAGAKKLRETLKNKGRNEVQGR